MEHFPASGVDDQSLAQAILDTRREPFLVMDEGLRIVSASRSFFETFRITPEATLGQNLYGLGDGQWDIRGLHTLLETIAREGVAMDDYEVRHEFPVLGYRNMLLNGQRLVCASAAASNILLTFTDVTAQRVVEREKVALLQAAEKLARDKQVLLNEMEHRVANSLQIIASILLLKARAVASEETRQHLTDAHQRVLSVAAVQAHLQASDGVDLIPIGPYLTKLCDSLASSMIGDSHAILLKVTSGPGVMGSAQAVSIGLIVTELVINALKYAFPTRRPSAQILVDYETNGDDWRLVVSDNGSGKALAETSTASTGLGTLIVKALVKQLGAHIEQSSGLSGHKVTVSRATFSSRVTANSDEKLHHDERGACVAEVQRSV